MKRRLGHCSPLLIQLKCICEPHPQGWKGTFEVKQRNLLKTMQEKAIDAADPWNWFVEITALYIFNYFRSTHWSMCAIVAKHTFVLFSRFALLRTNNPPLLLSSIFMITSGNLHAEELLLGCSLVAVMSQQSPPACLKAYCTWAWP